jgi:hypothetical protein
VAKEYLELTIEFADETDVSSVQRVGWQWRNGRCAKNGHAHSVEAAVDDAVAVYFVWWNQQ